MNLTDIFIVLVIIETSILIHLFTTLLSLRKERISARGKRNSTRPAKSSAKNKKKNFAISPTPPQAYSEVAVNFDKIKGLVKESEVISLNLSKNLEEKKEIVNRLLDTLDGRIQRFNRLVKKKEERENLSVDPEVRKEDHHSVLELAQKGYGVPDISRRLGLSKEEVQLTLDLNKMATN
jgi:hypothetical protein